MYKRQAWHSVIKDIYFNQNCVTQVLKKATPFFKKEHPLIYKTFNPTQEWGDRTVSYTHLDVYKRQEEDLKTGSLSNGTVGNYLQAVKMCIRDRIRTIDKIP